MNATNERQGSPSWLRLGGVSAAILLALTLSVLRADEPPADQPAGDQPAAAAESETTAPAAPAAPVPTITPDDVQALVKRVEQSTTLEETQRDAALSQLREAKAKLEEWKTWKDRAESFRKRIENAPQELERLRKPDPTTRPATTQPATSPSAASQPATASAPATQPAPDTSTLEGMETVLRGEQAKLDAEIAKVQAADEALTRRNTLLTEGPKQIAELREELVKLQGEPVKQDGPELLTLARQANRIATRMLLEQKAAALELEQRFYEAFGELLIIQRDRAVQRRDALDAAVKQARQRVVALRQQAAERAKEKAEDVSSRVRRLFPPIVDLIENNKQVADDLARLTVMIAESATAAESVEAIRTRVDNEYDEIKKKSEGARNSQSFGILLRNRRVNLPDTAVFRRRRDSWQAKISEASFKYSDYLTKRTQLANVEPFVQDMLDRVPASVSEADRQSIEAEIRQQIDQYKKNLQDILGTYVSLIDQLNGLDTTLTKLIQTTDEFAAYIDERILWVRSGRPIGEDRFTGLVAAAKWFFDADHWGAFLNAAADYYSKNWYLIIPGALAFAVLLAAGRTIRRKLRQYADEANKPLSVNFRVTLAACGLTLLAALPYPLLLWFIGQGFAQVPDSGDFALAVARGFRAAAASLLPLVILLQTSRVWGLGGAHLNWHPKSIGVIRRNLAWFAVASTPVAFVVALLSDQDVESHRETLGRDVFMLGMIFVTIFAARVLRPGAGAFAQYMIEHPRARSTRLRYAWFTASVAIPVALAVAAALGYYYTAQRLSSRLWLTAVIWGAAAFLYMLLTRGLLVIRRKIAIDQAAKKRASAQAKAKAERAAQRAAAQDDQETDAGDAPATPVEAPPINIPNLSEQTRQLIGTVMVIALALLTFGVWARDLPALAILNDVHIGWDITAADVGLALISAIVSIIAIRNVPALLEMTVLAHLPIDAGARYAVSAISRYTIATIGIIVTFGLLGVGWTKLQWLVAAVSVGLGFGLQEIFANFVSGLIILFERPIRVGDTVTVGGETGSVSRIRIRATTLIDWDNKERVIPNKRFVTDEITNWSLTNQVIRLVISVGVAYRSDPRQVREVLMETLLANKKVLDDPKPRVYFVGFGDSALTFECRAYFKDIDDWLYSRHQLHVDIFEACARNDIEIAFPQRDIHIRSIEAELPLKRVDHPREFAATDDDA